MMNKKVLFLLPLILLSSCESKKPKIEVDYDSIGGFIRVSKETYEPIFNKSKNILTIFSIKDANYCGDCLNVSFTDVEQYAIDQHFNIYFYEFDSNSKTFINDYVDIVNMMRVNNDNGLKELTYKDDGLPLIDGIPCLIYSSRGYIGYNVTNNFVKQLKETVTVKESS